jgi:hypothetical protein
VGGWLHDRLLVGEHVLVSVVEEELFERRNAARGEEGDAIEDD